MSAFASLPAADRRRLVAVLAVALFGISTSAVIVRGMEASPVAIAAWRSTGAALLLLPAWGPALPGLSPRARQGLVLAGVALAVHFVLWFASLSLTTVLRSTLLVCTTPVWAGLIDAVWDRKVPSRRWLAGVALALPGVGWMSGGAGGVGTWQGDALAVAGAVAAALYLRLGQGVRQEVGAAASMGAMCATSAALLWAFAMGNGDAMSGWPAQTWGLLVLAVLGPQLLGHQGFTYAVRWVPASTLALVVLLEPVGAALLAALVLGEVPSPSAVAGGLLVLAGVALAVSER